MQGLLSNDNFQDGPLKNASVAVFGIGKWCRAIIEYDQAMKIVRPKQKERDEAQAEANVAKAASDAAQALLAEKMAEIKKLFDELQQLQDEEKRLKDKKEDSERKIELAMALITSLAGERENWKVSLANRKNDQKNLIGDVIICSGIIAYLGIFI